MGVYQGFYKSLFKGLERFVNMDFIKVYKEFVDQLPT